MTGDARPNAGADYRAWAVGLAGFTAFLDLYATQGLLPLLSRTFHASELEVSATVSATTTAVALAAPLIGPLADVWGRKAVIVAAAFALSVPTFLAATATSLPALSLWRFVQGLFMPAIFAVTIAYVGEECPKGSVGRIMAGYVTGNILGGVSGRFLAAVVAGSVGWPWAFFTLGCLNVIAAFGLWALLPRSRNFVRERSVRTSSQAVLVHLKNPRLVAGYAVGFNVLFSIVSVFTYVNFYLARPPFELGTVELGSIFFVYLAAAVVMPLAGRWLDRVGSRVVLAVGMLAASGGVLCTLIQNLWAVLAGLALCASGIFVCQSAANSYVATSAGRARSAAAGLYVGVYYLGGTLGATVPGLAWRGGGWPSCVMLIVAVQLLTVGLALVTWRSPTSGHADSGVVPALRS
jgi:predicted MFS family arabinose efflux permease